MISIHRQRCRDANECVLFASWQSINETNQNKMYLVVKSHTSFIWGLEKYYIYA